MLKPAFIRLAAVGISLIPQTLSAAVTASNSYVSTSMTCAELRQVVEREGAAVMRWTSPQNPGAPRLLRVVRSTTQCDRPDAATEIYIPASDTPQCQVFECRQPNYIP